MLSVAMLNVVYAEFRLRRESDMLSVAYESFMLSVAMLSIVMLSVMAPSCKERENK